MQQLPATGSIVHSFISLPFTRYHVTCRNKRLNKVLSLFLINSLKDGDGWNKRNISKGPWKKEALSSLGIDPVQGIIKVLKRDWS